MSKFGNLGKKPGSNVPIVDGDRLERRCLSEGDRRCLLFAGRSGDEVQLEDLEFERVEVRSGDDVQLEDFECERVELMEARDEAESSNGLPLSAECNGSNFGQLTDLCDRPCVVHFLRFRTGGFLLCTSCLWWIALAESKAVGTVVLLTI